MMHLNRGLLFAAMAAISAAAVIGAVIVASGGGDGGSDGSAGPPATSATASPTRPAGIAPGEPTPPSGADTPVSNRDTPTPPTRVPPGPTQTPGATMRVLAPIDGAEIAVLESFPPQYLLKVKAGLPSGCAKPDGYEVSRTGDEIKVDVYNTLPVGNVVCTQIYGNYDLNINLGASFASGTEYRVAVNDRLVTFRAQ